MPQTNKKRFWLSLVLISLSCLSSCATESSERCPLWPTAGAKVASEVENFDGVSFWEWMGRLDKLRRQLELCNS